MFFLCCLSLKKGLSLSFLRSKRRGSRMMEILLSIIFCETHPLISFSFVFYLSVVTLHVFVPVPSLDCDWSCRKLQCSNAAISLLFISHSLDFEQKNLERCILTPLCCFLFFLACLSLSPSVSLFLPIKKCILSSPLSLLCISFRSSLFHQL